MKKLASAKKYKKILFNLGFFLVFSIFIPLKNPSYAVVQMQSPPRDTCDKVTVAVSESILCPEISTENNGQSCTNNPPTTNQGINNWDFILTLQSNDGQSHQIIYWTDSDFCTQGYLSGNPPGSLQPGWCQCIDNAIYQKNIALTVPAQGSTTVTIPRNPTQGSACGSYQGDFSIISVDGDSSCHFGQKNSGTAASGLCETGITCTAVATNYSISGNIYTDSDNTQHYNNPPDSLYTSGSNSITITGPTNLSVPITNGSYNTGATLPAGTYTVSYTIPTGYYISYPLNGSPPSFSVTIGANGACQPTTYNDESCTNGNISNLNFGITNVVSWFQTSCGDMRIDSGITDLIPSSASCNNTSGPYASMTNATCSTPGIIFSGTATANFGQGQASAAPYNWTVGNNSIAEKFKPAISTVIKTAYTSMIAKSRQSGLTPIDISTKCPLNNCTISNIAHGLYQTNPASPTDLHINNSALSGKQNYVFLVSGDLYLDGSVTIAQGSTATFSVAGNIYINQTVGNASATDTSANIEGFYSTDKSFIVQSTGTCPDLRLNISGSVIVNASLSGGSFQNNRNLCGSNASCPTISFTQRPDLILNAPTLMMYSNHIWKEVAPSN